METEIVRDRIRYKYEFSEEEIAQLAQILANKQIEKIDLEEEKKAVAADYKAKIDSVHNDINLTSRYVRDGWKFDFVEAIKRKNRAAGQWQWVHPDTGQVLQTEPLKPQDLQGDLFND